MKYSRNIFLYLQETADQRRIDFEKRRSKIKKRCWRESARERQTSVSGGYFFANIFY